jgi:hypothetical protein
MLEIEYDPIDIVLLDEMELLYIVDNVIDDNEVDMIDAALIDIVEAIHVEYEPVEIRIEHIILFVIYDEDIIKDDVVIILPFNVVTIPDNTDN